jgi:hypothetical protein
MTVFHVLAFAVGLLCGAGLRSLAWRSIRREQFGVR